MDNKEYAILSAINNMLDAGINDTDENWNNDTLLTNIEFTEAFAQLSEKEKKEVLTEAKKLGSWF